MAFLLKYFAGANQGVKRKVNAEKQIENKKRYEINREREFQTSWTKTRPWLLEEKEKMFYVWCRDLEPSSDTPFVQGCGNYRIDNNTT